MAQGTLFFQPIQVVFKAGVFVPSAKAYFYLAGTTTPVNVFADVLLTTPLTQPVVADASNGAFVEIFLTPGVAYKVDIQTAAGVSLPGYPADNQLAVPASAATVDSTETAGEAITAGQAVYLSDGSGGKNAGQLYKADAANTYSSTLGLVGMAPSSIASGSTGTFRTAGQVTGLTVIIGNDYFVGTAGAITTTPPTNARYLGRADSTTSLILSRGLAALSLPSFLSLSQAAGAGIATLATQTANTSFLGPISGAAAAPTFRAIDPQDIESLFATVTTQFDATTATLANVPGLSVTLVAGKTYHLDAWLRMAMDATGGFKVGTGGTATATTFAASAVSFTSNANLYYDSATALGTILTRGGVGGTTGVVLLRMYIVVNAGGTFTIQFAQSASPNNTSSVLVGSYLQAM